MKERVAGRLLLAVGMLLPLSAVGVVAYNFSVLCVPGVLPLWAAVLIGLALGVLVLFIFTAASGSDLMDLMVSSIYVVLFSVVLMPVFARAKANAVRHKHHAAPARTQAPAKTP